MPSDFDINIITDNEEENYKILMLCIDEVDKVLEKYRCVAGPQNEGAVLTRGNVTVGFVD